MPYISIIKEKLSNSEALALAMSDIPLCVRVPQGCQRNAIFVIEGNAVNDPADVRNDLNSVFGKCHEIKWKPVESKVDNVATVQVIANRKVTLKTHQMFMKVHWVENRYVLIRNIVYIKTENGGLDKIILQYYINRKICGEKEEVSYSVSSHGNVKSSKPFYIVKKSMLQEIKEEVRNRGKRCIGLVYDEVHKKAKDDADYGDLPQSKKQLVDLTSPKLPDNEVGDLLAYNQEMGEEDLVWYHGDILSDLWVIGNRTIAREMHISAGCHPISVDPTFNFGAFEVTPFTYRNSKIECKSKNVKGLWVTSTMIGPSLIQQSKDEETYELGIRSVAQKCNLKDEQISVITDGEQALIKACNRNFANCSMLGCTKHFKDNCEEVLKAIGIAKSEMGPMLDVVFGEDGLVEAENKQDLKEKMRFAINLLDDIERTMVQLPEESKTQFSEYLREREKSVLRKLIRVPGGKL